MKRNMNPLAIEILMHYCTGADAFPRRSTHIAWIENKLMKQGFLSLSADKATLYEATDAGREWLNRLQLAAGDILHRVRRNIPAPTPKATFKLSPETMAKIASFEGLPDGYPEWFESAMTTVGFGVDRIESIVKTSDSFQSLTDRLLAAGHLHVHKGIPTDVFTAGMDGVRVTIVGKSPIQEAREAMGEDAETFGDLMARLVAASRSEVRERMASTFDDRYTLFKDLGEDFIVHGDMSRSKWKHVFDIVFARTAKLTDEPLCRALYNAMKAESDFPTTFDKVRKIALETLPVTK